MSPFPSKRFPGLPAIGLGLAAMGAFVFLFTARGSCTDASARWQRDTAEFDRLQRLSPFPTGENVRKMKAHAEDYAAVVAKVKEALTTRVPPVAPLAPNEFQNRLRHAATSLGQKARGMKTKLPENFFLGYEEFTSALPNTAAAPLLGQQLGQVEALVSLVLEARVDAITALRRSALGEEGGVVSAASSPPAGRKPSAGGDAGSKLVERSFVDLSFVSSPAAARRVLNSIAAADHQFFIIRLLQVRNEKDKGPAREATAEASAPGGTAAAPTAAKAPSALNFIVGNEHVQTSARIEIVRFSF